MEEKSHGPFLVLFQGMSGEQTSMKIVYVDAKIHQSKN